jgi:hypothetical protein
MSVKREKLEVFEIRARKLDSSAFLSENNLTVLNDNFLFSFFV